MVLCSVQKCTQFGTMDPVWYYAGCLQSQFDPLTLGSIIPNWILETNLVRTLLPTKYQTRCIVPILKLFWIQKSTLWNHFGTMQYAEKFRVWYYVFSMVLFSVQKCTQFGTMDPFWYYAVYRNVPNLVLWIHFGTMQYAKKFHVWYY